MTNEKVIELLKIAVPQDESLDEEGLFLEAVNMAIAAIRQQEIIHCKDCVYHDWVIVDGPYGLAQEIHWCNKFYDKQDKNLAVLPNDFCNWGRRKT
jgi:hypothetical protein